jgi:hypothetical protein
MTFKELIIEDKDEYYYYQAIGALEYNISNNLTENFLKLPKPVQQKIDFINQIIEISKYNIKTVLTLFKDKYVFKFFKMIKFSFVKLYNLLKNGHKYYVKMQKIIAHYVASQGVVKFTEAKLKELDIYLQNHKILKKMGGIAVGGILLYIWLNMSFSGTSLEFDMSFEDIINALAGKFSLSELFAGDDGIHMLLLFVTGVTTGLTFPYPGPTSVQMICGTLYGLYKIKFPNGNLIKQIKF